MYPEQNGPSQVTPSYYRSICPTDYGNVFLKAMKSRFLEARTYLQSTGRETKQVCALHKIRAQSVPRTHRVGLGASALPSRPSWTRTFAAPLTEPDLWTILPAQEAKTCKTIRPDNARQLEPQCSSRSEISRQQKQTIPTYIQTRQLEPQRPSSVTF